jgi:amino acid adenylation domain-containing protein
MATFVPEQTFPAYSPAPDCHSARIHEAVEAQAWERPNAVALTAGTQVMTYQELDLAANSLASRLLSSGVHEDVPVGLCLPRNLEMVSGALAILKAGGAYLPMDPAYPVERLEYILEDAGAPVLVTNTEIASRLSPGGRNVIAVDSGAGEWGQASDRPGAASRSNLAYVVYTSGSTGKPKGVEVTHRNLWNLVSWHRLAFSVTPNDRASHMAGLSFDAAVWELWPYLTAGASVHLADDAVRLSPELLRDWLLERAITISFAPTPIAERLMALDWPRNTPLRILLTGGDALRRCPPAGLPFRVINNYGPTECTVVATSGEVPSGAEQGVLLPSIGRAVANTRLYVMDDAMQEVPAGAPGELHIAGSGVARGYRNHPDWTAARFVPDPFGAEPGARMYKTGDLARQLPDGRIEFLGRMDDQIKIRGYRIEPNEVIAALCGHPAVCESLVVAREEASGDRQLTCYLVLQSHSLPALEEIRDFLRRSLPEYMIPAIFVVLEAFPLTQNGKIDRAALPAPNCANTLRDAASTESPLTELEQRVAAIAAALLNRETLGAHDNFFLLGGHSLLGAQLIVRLRDAFGVEIPLRRLFASPTVTGLAEEIKRLAPAGAARS